MYWRPAFIIIDCFLFNAGMECLASKVIVLKDTAHMSQCHLKEVRSFPSDIVLH